MKLLFRLSLFAVLTAGAALVATGCTTGPTGCLTDGDCDGATPKCIPDTGACVACLTFDDCSDGAACCRGECKTPDSFEDNCGCAPAPGGSAGSVCGASQPVCAVDLQRVTGANLADGDCGSPCYPDLGGTISAVDNTEERGFACTCNGADDYGTCSPPYLREDDRPHIGSDTCAPDNQCICFYNGQGGRCGAAAPDCTLDGCVDLHDDNANCGISGRDCTLAENGLDDGTGICVNAGCQCNAGGDCQGDGLNVDSCVLDSNVGQCVCDDYTVAGVKSACPMQMPCVTGGCEFEGSIFGTQEDLLTALGIDQSVETDGGS